MFGVRSSELAIEVLTKLFKDVEKQGYELDINTIVFPIWRDDGISFH